MELVVLIGVNLKIEDPMQRSLPSDGDRLETPPLSQLDVRRLKGAARLEEAQRPRRLPGMEPIRIA